MDERGRAVSGRKGRASVGSMAALIMREPTVRPQSAYSPQRAVETCTLQRVFGVALAGALRRSLELRNVNFQTERWHSVPRSP